MNMLDHRIQIRRPYVAGTGFTVLDRVYADDTLADEAMGGSCANVLVSLAMLGHHVAPVLRLGADEEGERLVSEFARAGATTEFISRLAHLRSPILAEKIDTNTAKHVFSFRCPVTDLELPRYDPIGSVEVQRAHDAVEGCSIFYTDRLTPDILTAMRLANQAGAYVVFEPSAITNSALYAAALKETTVLKTSADRLGDIVAPVDADVGPIVQIVTYGAEGLEIRDRSEAHYCAASNAPVLRDACGSGDMVTVGLIDDLLTKRTLRTGLAAMDLVAGISGGQRLAAANCAYEGARGLFRRRGSAYARALLDGIVESNI